MKHTMATVRRRMGWIAGCLVLALPMTGCMHNKVQAAVTEANAAMLAPLLSGSGEMTAETRNGTGKKLVELIGLNDGNPEAVSRLRVRHAMLYTASTSSSDEDVARASWDQVSESHLSGRDLELYRSREPLMYWFRNSEKPGTKFWKPTVDQRLKILEQYITTLTSSINRLAKSSDAQLYLADKRIEIQTRMLPRKKEVGETRNDKQPLNQTDVTALRDYLDLQPPSYLAAVERVAETKPGSAAAFKEKLLENATSAKDAYRPYIIASHISAIKGVNLTELTGALPAQYGWVKDVPPEGNKE